MASEENKNKSEKKNLPRRSFLGLIWAGLGGIAVLEAGVITVIYMKPRLSEGEFGNIITVGPVSDFPAGSVTLITNGRFYLSRLEDGGFLALFQRCTHLGCSVPWIQKENKFICPCHNSQFDVTGEVMSPPASRAMDLFRTFIEDGIIKVDTGKIINRNHFDSTQVVYA
jgi:cytochrome b6-f complex iron-sulfur subunit